MLVSLDQHLAQTGPSEPGFSVALCTYNGENFLPAQLESIAKQQVAPQELVVCDDGSSDSTVAIAKAYAQRVPFPVVVVRNPFNLGYGSNFVKALSLCRKKIIAFCDQDDVWYPEKLARLEEVFRSQPAVGGVFSNGHLIDEQSKRLAGDLWASFAFSAQDQKRLSSGHALAVLMQRNVVTGMTFAIRAEFRDRLEGLPANWPHDAWLALMLAAEGKLGVCPEHLVAYRVHGKQTIGIPITPSEKWQYLRSRGLGSYFELSRSRNAGEYRLMKEQFIDLLNGFEASAQGKEEMLLQARLKVTHASAALERLSQPRSLRWLAMLGSATLYRRYSSTGLKAFLRDLIL